MSIKEGQKLACSLLFLAALEGAAARAQTDIGLSPYGAFGNAVDANNAAQTEDRPSGSAGGMIELRHISSPLAGYEATYSFNRANQTYRVICYNGCSPVAAVSANADEITGDWLISARAGRIRPFALAGAGVLFTEPTGGQSYTQSSTTAVYVYGAGLDWRLLPHLGLRFQYRGNVHKAPYITTVYGSADAFTHTAEPMAGAYYRF